MERRHLAANLQGSIMEDSSNYIRIMEVLHRVDTRVAAIDQQVSTLCRCSQDLEIRMRLSERFRSQAKGVVTVLTVGGGAIGAWFMGLKDVLDITINL